VNHDIDISGLIRSLNRADENLRGAAYAALATLALIAALKLVARFFRKLRNRYEDEQGAGLRLQQWEMVSADKFRRSVRYFLGFLHLLVTILLIDIYVTLVLRFFPDTEALSDQYFELITSPIAAFFRAVIAYIPDLLYITVVSTLTLVGLRFLRLFFRAIETGSVRVPGFYTDWADPTYKLVRVLVLLFLLIAVFPHLPGADEHAFKAVSLFVGALVTLGSTAAVGNSVAGVVLIYTAGTAARIEPMVGT